MLNNGAILFLHCLIDKTFRLIKCWKLKLTVAVKELRVVYLGGKFSVVLFFGAPNMGLFCLIVYPRLA